MEDYKNETIESYNKHARFFEKYFRRNMSNHDRPEFGRFLELLQGKKMLDLGCGSGDHMLWFKQKNLEVKGVDISKSMIEICREKGLDAEVMDIENLDLDEDSFDGIWAVTSLLHVPKKKIKDVIKKLHEILKNGGILFVDVKKGEGESVIQDKNDKSTKRFFSFWKEEEFVDNSKDYFQLIEGKEVVVGKTTYIEMFFKNIKNER